MIRSFREKFGTPPEVYSSAPGRINLIGEHTDYNLGYVLPSAIHLHVAFLASGRTDGIVRIWADNFKQEKSFSLQQDVEARRGGWIDYVKGIFWVLSKQGASLRGIDAYVWGNIPLESGLSSSAALEVSIISALDVLFKLGLSPLEIAKLAQAAENDYVGVKCGLMDQFVSVFGKKDKAVFLDCDTLAYEYIPLRLTREDLGILVYDTRVPRDLASSAYNKRRSEAMGALERLREYGIQTYKDVTLSLLDEKKNELGETYYKRARHVVAENERVKKAVSALRDDNFHELGRLLFQSHKSLRDDYQVSCPELDLLFECGKKSQSCLGARLTGAGFGGSGIALIRKKDIPSFKMQVSDEAQRRGFVTPACYEVEIGEGMRTQIRVK
ncbi:MAG: galactokinase [Candidatus Aminicenantes bacterium]|nr:MAG: galactokinase [Candidatus Aminicenantes bacterium]